MSGWRQEHWSYTKWSKYQTCPLQADYKYNQRAKSAPPGPAMERGIKVHTWAEHFLKGSINTIHPEVGAPWTSRMRALKKGGAVAEEPWAFDRQWAVAPYTYRDPRGWCRMKLDAHTLHPGHVEVIDFKTGGIYDEHADQSHLFATGSFLRFPEAESVRVQFYYWDKRHISTYEYSREYDLAHMIQTWETRYEEMQSETRFLPRPGRHCRRCDFAKSKGGPCAYGA